jgi:MarR family transcriptional regulator, temperature-dependent positive regulator of motility
MAPFRARKDRETHMPPKQAEPQDHPQLALFDLPGHLIRRLQQIAVSIFIGKCEAAGHDLTPVQFAALTTIRNHDGMAQTTLAGMIAYDAATLGGVVERLVQKGLVRRETSPQDRRAKSLHLTQAGEALLDAVAPVVIDVQTAILAGLTPAEQRTFMHLLRKATDAGNALSRAPIRKSGEAPKRDD